MYELRKGEKLNKYQIIDLLGRGAMGEVYKARDPDTGVVAIKVLREDLGKEIAPRKMPSHKNIVIIYAVERTPRDTKFIVMEYYSGHDLKKYSSRMRSQLAREQYYLEMCQIVAQCCEGLEHAHQHGIIHRDIKPANIFILDTPRRSTDWVKILDFGIAKITGGTTTAHGQVGTLPYMSPEHLISSVDSFSDQFSLGIVFYELLAGRRPFNATDSRDLQRQIVNEPAPERSI